MSAPTPDAVQPGCDEVARDSVLTELQAVEDHVTASLLARDLRELTAGRMLGARSLAEALVERGWRR